MKGRPGALTRRSLLAGAGTLAGSAALMGVASAQVVAQPAPQVPDDPTKVQGRPPNEVGERSPFEQPKRTPSATSSQTPLDLLNGIITPSDVHYERHHAGVPLIDPNRYTLTIHGLVDRPTVFTLDDLKRFPSLSRIMFLECSGNSGSGWTKGPATGTAQTLHGLTSTSDWTGVSVATLLKEVGVQSTAAWALAEGEDAAVLSRSVPIDKLMDDAFVAYGQNGEALRPEQGYPARLMLPGWEGNINVKWLRRLKLGDQPFETREETSKYTDPLPGQLGPPVHLRHGGQVDHHLADDAYWGHARLRGRGRFAASPGPAAGALRASKSALTEARPGQMPVWPTPCCRSPTPVSCFPGRGRAAKQSWSAAPPTRLATCSQLAMSWSRFAALVRSTISTASKTGELRPTAPLPITMPARARALLATLSAATLGLAACAPAAPAPVLATPTTASAAPAKPTTVSVSTSPAPSASAAASPSPSIALASPAPAAAASPAASPAAKPAASPAVAAASPSPVVLPTPRPAPQAPVAGTFGFGRPAAADEIKKIDIEVRPDGAGLPTGSGTSAQGRPIFAQKCAACHGPNGEGTSAAPKLIDPTPFKVGVTAPTVGNYWPYATTVWDYINRAMPFDKPGSLTPDEVYALTAFLLAENKVIGEGDAMDAQSLPRVTMPNASGFSSPDPRPDAP